MLLLELVSLGTLKTSVNLRSHRYDDLLNTNAVSARLKQGLNGCVHSPIGALGAVHISSLQFDQSSVTFSPFLITRKKK